MPSIIFILTSFLEQLNQWFRNGTSSECEGDCVVCLSKIGAGERLRSLSECRHSFHLRCIDAWLKVRPTCPLCRTDIVPRRNLLVSSSASFVERIGKLIEKNPFLSEIKSAVCECFGYV
ncbi:hypothetical protein V6N13_016639 [Hibiscus sabdariffa]|uniref:RING-type E3 ubiquitin transferase n=1 Tax=Hibiscus sabdariffa TaxID=183260 RepID=A0ABR2NMW1_9ROSI